MKRKFKFKSAALVSLFVVFWIFVFFTLQCLLVPKYQTGIVEGAMIAEYYDEKTDHEVIMVGDCELYENISPVELWREYGITSYIRGSAQQLVWQSYYLLEDTLRYEKPKVAVFNVLSLKYDEPQKETYNRMTIDGMKWSMSKVGAIKASMTEEEDFIDYLFPILRYHSRWSELTEDDFEYIFKKEKVTHNGYYMRNDIRSSVGFPDPLTLTDYKLGDNAMGYLDKMTQLCKDNGIELVLIKAPIEYPHWYDEWDEQIEEYANENGLTYINFIPLKEEIGLNMSVDTYDAGLHLNLTGAEKFSEYFGKWLVDNYDLTDYRDNSGYTAVWEEKVSLYEQQKQEQLTEISVHGKLVSAAPVEVKESNVMRNLIILLVLSALCISLVACGPSIAENSADESESESVQSQTSQTPDTPADPGYVLTLNQTDISIGADVEPIVAALGEPTSYFESASCAYQGMDKIYTYGGVIIRTYPNGSADCVLNIEIKDDTVSTKEGVCIGDSKEKVEDVYGVPASSNETSLIYKKGVCELSFILKDGAVSSITYIMAESSFLNPLSLYNLGLSNILDFSLTFHSAFKVPS